MKLAPGEIIFCAPNPANGPGRSAYHGWCETIFWIQPGILVGPTTFLLLTTDYHCLHVSSEINLHVLTPTCLEAEHITPTSKKPTPSYV